MTAERDPLATVLEAAKSSVEYHGEREAEYPGYVWIEWDDLVRFVEAADGCRLVPDEPHHYVNFDEDGWFIEHSVECRIAGTIGTCAYNQAIRKITDEAPDADDLGRWRITDIDSEGLPSFERAERP